MTSGETIDRYCVYAVATDYDALHAALRDRAHELQATREGIDLIAGLQPGYAGKVLAPTPIKALGRMSLGPMLQTLGLALVVVVDDESFKRISDRLPRRERPLQAFAGTKRRKHLFNKKTAREMAKRRRAKMSDKRKKLFARKGALARWKKWRQTRRNARQK